jgi:hypothetical protein
MIVGLGMVRPVVVGLYCAIIAELGVPIVVELKVPMVVQLRVEEGVCRKVINNFSWPILVAVVLIDRTPGSSVGRVEVLVEILTIAHFMLQEVRGLSIAAIDPIEVLVDALKRRRVGSMPDLTVGRVEPHILNLTVNWVEPHSIRMRVFLIGRW